MGNGDITNEKIDGLRRSVCLYIPNIPMISTPFHSIPLKSPCSVCGGEQNKSKFAVIGLYLNIPF